MTPASERRLLDLTVVIACRDDDERIGHVLRRVATHLRKLRVRFEMVAVDEGSSDNTLALLSLMRRQLPELQVVTDVEPGRGLVRGAQLAHGRALVVMDARSEPPLSALGFALERLDAGADVVALAGRCLVLRRTRCWRAFDALSSPTRDPHDLEHRFLRRAKLLGLQITVPAPRRAASPWQRLRSLLRAPLAI